MTADEIEVVLVHGAFRGAWAVQPTVEQLHGAGVTGHAWDLPGAGDRWDPQVVVTLEEVVADLAERVAGLPARVLLVGHSQGGLVVRALRGREPENVAAIAYLDAAVPDAGERAVDLVDSPDGRARADLAGDLVIDPPPVPANLPSEIAGVLDRRLRPQHAAMALGRVEGAVARLPEHWAFCAGTPDGFPSGVTRRRCDRRGIDYALLDAEHDVPLVAPWVAADWLMAVIAAVR